MTRVTVGKLLPCAYVPEPTSHDLHRSFRAEALTCRPGQNTSTCLTPIQTEALHRIYTDYYEANQTWIFGGYYPGGETAFPVSGYATAEPGGTGTDWFRYFILK